MTRPIRLKSKHIMGCITSRDSAAAADPGEQLRRDAMSWGSGLEVFESPELEAIKSRGSFLLLERQNSAGSSSGIFDDRAGRNNASHTQPVSSAAAGGRVQRISTHGSTASAASGSTRGPTS